jgi:hypothetical protein
LSGISIKITSVSYLATYTLKNQEESLKLAKNWEGGAEIKNSGAMIAINKLSLHSQSPVREVINF